MSATGRFHHGSAATTAAVRRAMPHGQESPRARAKRCGVNRRTVAKWRSRSSAADVPTGPKNPTSTVLTVEEEAVIVAFRRHALLPLDDCLHALQATIPKPTRSSVHRRLHRRGIGRLPEVEGEAPARTTFKSCPTRCADGPTARCMTRMSAMRCRENGRAPLHEARPSPDERTGRAAEPNDQGRHRQAPPPRQPRAVAQPPR